MVSTWALGLCSVSLSDNVEPIIAYLNIDYRAIHGGRRVDLDGRSTFSLMRIVIKVQFN